MSNLTSVTLTAGVPTAGTGTVSTLDNLPTLLNKLPVELTDGSGNAITSTGNALDINIKSGANANGRKSAANSAPTTDSGLKYQAVTASASATALTGGGGGATGDYLAGLVCVVATASTSQVQITDGSGSAITVLPNAVGAGVGTYQVPLGIFSTSGAWKVTTAAGVSVVAVGDFT